MAELLLERGAALARARRDAAPPRSALGCLERAFDGAEAILAAVIRKGRFWTQLGAQPFNARHREILNRLLDGFEGKLTTSR